MYTETMTYRDAGAINSAMGRVYGHMSLAVLTSMIVSFLVGTNATLMAFFFTGIMKWIVIFAPLVAVFAITFLMEKVGKARCSTDATRICGINGSELCYNFCHL